MYVPPEVRRRLWLVPVGLVLVLPGWSGRLVPVDHEEILQHSRRARDVFGVTRAAADPAEEWHAQYMDSEAASLLDDLRLRGLTTRLVAPDYVAHIPARTRVRGVELPARADAYFRVETGWRWPWWWPGGGVAWEVPE
jgi:hypothetical protein